MHTPQTIGGQNTPIPEIFVLPPNKNDGQSSEVVPPPPLLSLQEPGKSSSSSDHDYEELVSQPNSINVEKIVSDKKTTVPIVENGASARSHCPLVKNNSMPILERKEHRPAAHHEYDEPNNFRKKIPDYQNKSMIIVNQNKNRMRIGRTHTVSGPWIRRAAPSSKTEDYEVPVMSFGHETRQRASSATTRPFKHSSPVKTKLSKAKSLLVETHVQHSNQQASTKNEGGSLIKDSTAEAADCMPKSTGSCLFELGTEVCQITYMCMFITPNKCQYHYIA